MTNKSGGSITFENAGNNDGSSISWDSEGEGMKGAEDDFKSRSKDIIVIYKGMDVKIQLLSPEVNYSFLFPTHCLFPPFDPCPINNVFTLPCACFCLLRRKGPSTCNSYVRMGTSPKPTFPSNPNCEGAPPLPKLLF